MIESETIQLERLDTGTSYWERKSVAAAKGGSPYLFAGSKAKRCLRINKTMPKTAKSKANQTQPKPPRAVNEAFRISG